MKLLSKIGVWLAVFVIVLIWRLPYETIIGRVLSNAERVTGISITWEDMSMGLTGVNLKKLLVSLPSGSRFTADTAFISYSWKGLHMQFRQYDSPRILAAAMNRTPSSDESETSGRNSDAGGVSKGKAGPAESSISQDSSIPGSASLALDASQLEFKSENLALETGSKDLQAVQLSGQLSYNYQTSHGKGVLNFKVPALKASLPVELYNLEIGSTLTIEPDGIGAGAEGNKALPNSSEIEENVETNNLDPQPPSGSTTGRRVRKAHRHTNSKRARSGRELKIDNRLTLYSPDVTGEGVVFMYTNQDNPPELDGTITFKTKIFGTHKVDIAGTWANPEWNIAGVR
ncbi:MAG: hypothetical protein K6A35_07555 [bacterium]|nr:hypothetical protein [bacterium]